MALKDLFIKIKKYFNNFYILWYNYLKINKTLMSIIFYYKNLKVSAFNHGFKIENKKNFNIQYIKIY